MCFFCVSLYEKTCEFNHKKKHSAQKKAKVFSEKDIIENFLVCFITEVGGVLDVAILRNLIAKLCHPMPIAQTTPSITKGSASCYAKKKFTKDTNKGVHERFQESAKNGYAWTYRDRSGAPTKIYGVCVRVQPTDGKIKSSYEKLKEWIDMTRLKSNMLEQYDSLKEEAAKAAKKPAAGKSNTATPQQTDPAPAVSHTPPMTS